MALSTAIQLDAVRGVLAALVKTARVIALY